MLKSGQDGLDEAEEAVREPVRRVAGALRTRGRGGRTLASADMAFSAAPYSAEGKSPEVIEPFRVFDSQDDFNLPSHTCWSASPMGQPFV